MEAEERATLTAFLDFQRDTLALKCDGLTDGQLQDRAVRRVTPESVRRRHRTWRDSGTEVLRSRGPVSRERLSPQQ